MLRVSRRLLLFWRRQSRPPSLRLATSTSLPEQSWPLLQNGRVFRAGQGAGGDAARPVLEHYQPDVGDPRLERGNQQIVGRVTLRRRRAVGHGGVGDLFHDANPGPGVLRDVRRRPPAIP